MIGTTALLWTRFQWDRHGVDGAGSRKAGSPTSSSARVQYINRSVGTSLWDVGSTARPRALQRVAAQKERGIVIAEHHLRDLTVTVYLRPGPADVHAQAISQNKLAFPMSSIPRSRRTRPGSVV